VNQIVGLLLASYILSHPDVFPQWMSSFEVSRLGTLQPGESVCGHAGIRHKRDVDGMMGHMPVMNLSTMRGPMMHGHGHMNDMMHGPMMHGSMMSDEVIQDGSQSVRGKSKSVDNREVFPRVDDLILPGQVMPDVGNMIPEADDSVGVQLAKVLSEPDNKVSTKPKDAAAAAAADADDDDRDLMIPFGHHDHDNSPFHNNVRKYGRVGLNAG